MKTGRKTKEKIEFGDFQTPLALAQAVCSMLARQGAQPRAVIEPSCGEGSFVQAALEQFSAPTRVIGVEVNCSYVARANAMLETHRYGDRAEVLHGDFFAMNWPELLAGLPEPILAVGNPPWVTNAELGALGSANLPAKSNFQRRRGFDAISGKANFDISEWMLIKFLHWLSGREATLAMLCKTSVARKALLHAWKEGIPVKRCTIHRIDADRSFGACVDACLLVCELSSSPRECNCEVYERLGDSKSAGVIGYRDGALLADIIEYERWKHLRGHDAYRWRSGIKHDCRNVMEFHAEGTRFRNGLGELVELEEDRLYPMLKSSQVANGSWSRPSRYMLVTQRSVGEDTRALASLAPKTWEYLLSHAERLDHRASSIYRNRPRFSVFGVGAYAFAPWKVAIGALHKRLSFEIVGSFRDKPIVLDDTSYFIACRSRDEAEFIHRLVSSDPARRFLSAFIFWDAKRPITVDILKQLSLEALASEMHEGPILERFADRNQPTSVRFHQQRRLFDGA